MSIKTEQEINFPSPPCAMLFAKAAIPASKMVLEIKTTLKWGRVALNDVSVSTVLSKIVANAAYHRN